jgi:hypothetical protein
MSVDNGRGEQFSRDCAASNEYRRESTMTRNRMLILVSVVFVILALAVVAFAQREPQGDEGGGPPGMMGPMIRPGMGMPGPGAQMAVSDDAVYILAGAKLMKFNADTLELETEAELPRPDFTDRPGPPGVP